MGFGLFMGFVKNNKNITRLNLQILADVPHFVDKNITFVLFYNPSTIDSLSINLKSKLLVTKSFHTWVGEINTMRCRPPTHLFRPLSVDECCLLRFAQWVTVD